MQMNDFTVFIKEIKQKDFFTFTILWTDGKITDYRLSELQKNCTCARCRDEKTGQLLIQSKDLKNDVQANSIRNIGRYALKVDFCSGCSKGIYTFSFLRQLKV